MRARFPSIRFRPKARARPSVPLSGAHRLPVWRRPVALLCVMAMPVAFATSSSVLNNFVVEVAGFDGSDIGWLHTVRETPGFFAVAVIALLILLREQGLGLALVCLAVPGVATAITAEFPGPGGLLMVTVLSSIGFHDVAPVNQSLQLQWIDKARAPRTLGWIIATGSAAMLLAPVLIVLTWEAFALSCCFVCRVSGASPRWWRWGAG